MIHFVNGDMFDTAADIRVNAVNCVGVMGAGVALAFKRRFPKMFADYRQACRRGHYTPGCIQVHRSDDHEWIINAATKNHWRRPSEYTWIESVLGNLREFIFDDAVLVHIFEENGRKLRITIPALGCGHGGLRWGRVKALIVRYLSDLDADVFVFAPLDSPLMGKKESGKHAV